MLLGVAVWTQQGREDAPAWVVTLYAAASRICHQRPERSFFRGAVQWPVCGRCAGLYLAAPFGAVLALGSARRRDILRSGGPSAVANALADSPQPWRRRSGPPVTLDRPVRGAQVLIALAVLPSLATLGIEWLDLAAVSNTARALAAAPLGAAIAWTLVRVTLPARADGVH